MIEFFNSLDMFSKTLFFMAFGTGVLFIIQNLIVFLGMDHDSDIDTDSDIDSEHNSGKSFGWFSFKNVVNFILIFSLVGLITVGSGISKPVSLLIASIAGIIFVYVMILLFNLMKKLSQDNTPTLTDLVGETGVVYLKIPAVGNGKIKIMHGGAIQILDACSEGIVITRDSNVKVSKIVGHTIIVEEIK